MSDKITKEEKGILKKGAEFTARFNKALGILAVGGAIALKLIGAPAVVVTGTIIFAGLQFVESAVWKKLSNLKNNRKSKNRLIDPAVSQA